MKSYVTFWVILHTDRQTDKPKSQTKKVTIIIITITIIILVKFRSEKRSIFHFPLIPLPSALIYPLNSSQGSGRALYDHPDLVAGFFSRDAMHSADYAVARFCPSVRPSVTRWYSVEIITHILKNISPSGSHTILVSIMTLLRLS